MTHSVERIVSPLRAAELLDAGKLVAFPTETVYGLGVDATNAAAVERLFAVKGRPGNNPLIVHISTLEQLNSVASELPPLALQLLKQFSPGPLTVVVPKHPSIVTAVTAGLNTVGVRIPDHPQALEMLRACRHPIAAPSANRSGRPSATNLASVLEDFESYIDGILVASPSRIGLESTVVDCLSDPPRVLRPGAISLLELQRAAPHMVLAGASHRPGDNSPGRLHPHYKPKAKVRLFDRPGDLVPNALAAYIGIDSHAAPGDWGWHVVYATIEEFAAGFYECLREADRRGCAQIVCQRVSDQGTGAALMDRMQRAAE